MATLDENIAIIRNRGIYGTDIRAAIADAIEQSDALVDSHIDEIRQEIDAASTYMEVEPVAGSENDYILNIIHRG